MCAVSCVAMLHIAPSKKFVCSNRMMRVYMPVGLLGLSRNTMFNICFSICELQPTTSAFVCRNLRLPYGYCVGIVTMCSMSVFDRVHDDVATTHIGLCKLHKYRVTDNGNDVIDSMNSIHENASTSIQLCILLVCIDLRMKRQRVLKSPKITSYSIVSRDDGMVFQ